MSDIIIVAGLKEEKALAEINEWLIEKRNQRLKDTTKSWGGNRRAQLSCWAGAISHLGAVDDFMQMVGTVGWEDKESVRIIIQEEDIEVFKLT